MNTEYQAIEAHTLADIEVRVRSETVLGWKPFGGPTVTLVPGNGGCGPDLAYIQPMVRHARQHSPRTRQYRKRQTERW